MPQPAQESPPAPVFPDVPEKSGAGTADQKPLLKVVKTFQLIASASLPAIRHIYRKCCLRSAMSIINDYFFILLIKSSLKQSVVVPSCFLQGSLDQNHQDPEQVFLQRSEVSWHLPVLPLTPAAI